MVFAKAQGFFFTLSFSFFAFALLHAFLPFISSFDTFRWFQVFVIIFGFLLLGRSRTKLFIVCSLIAFLFLLSPFSIPYPFVFAIFDLGYWVSVILVAFYLVANGLANSGLAKWASLAAGIGCILYLPTILLGLGFWYAQGEGLITDFLPFGFYGIRPWSHLATWLMPLIIVAILLNSELPLLRHKLWKGLLVFAATFWFLVLIGSGARGSLIAQILSFLVLLIIFGKQCLPVAKVWGLTFCLGLLFYWALVVALPSMIFSETGDYSVFRAGASGRLELWQYALELSLREFPMGVGPLSYISETPVSALGTPHSIYFRWAAEYGWLFVGAFIGGVVWLGLPSWKKIGNCPAKKYDLFSIAICWSVISAFIHASVSGVFTSPYSLVVGFPILTVFFGYFWKERFLAAPQIKKSRIPSHIAAILFALSIAVLPSMYAWQMGAKADSNDYIEEHRSPLSPRFWLHGRYIGKS